MKLLIIYMVGFNAVATIVKVVLANKITPFVPPGINEAK